LKKLKITTMKTITDNTSKTRIQKTVELLGIIANFLVIAFLVMTVQHSANVLGKYEQVEAVAWLLALGLDSGIAFAAFVATMDDLADNTRITAAVWATLLILASYGLNLSYYLEQGANLLSWAYAAIFPVSLAFLGAIKPGLVIVNAMQFPPASNVPTTLPIVPNADAISAPYSVSGFGSGSGPSENNEGYANAKPSAIFSNQSSGESEAGYAKGDTDYAKNTSLANANAKPELQPSQADAKVLLLPIASATAKDTAVNQTTATDETTSVGPNSQGIANTRVVDNVAPGFADGVAGITLSPSPSLGLGVKQSLVYPITALNTAGAADSGGDDFDTDWKGDNTLLLSSASSNENESSTGYLTSSSEAALAQTREIASRSTRSADVSEEEEEAAAAGTPTDNDNALLKAAVGGRGWRELLEEMSRVARQVQKREIGIKEFDGSVQTVLAMPKFMQPLAEWARVNAKTVAELETEIGKLGRQVQRREIGTQVFDKQLEDLLKIA